MNQLVYIETTTCPLASNKMVRLANLNLFQNVQWICEKFVSSRDAQ